MSQKSHRADKSPLRLPHISHKEEAAPRSITGRWSAKNHIVRSLLPGETQPASVSLYLLSLLSLLFPHLAVDRPRRRLDGWLSCLTLRSVTPDSVTFARRRRLLLNPWIDLSRTRVTDLSVLFGDSNFDQPSSIKLSGNGSSVSVPYGHHGHPARRRQTEIALAI